MEESHVVRAFSNNTAKYFYKLSLIAFYTGFPNFWIENLNVSKRLTDLNSKISRLVTVAIYIFIVLEYGALLTQKNLTVNQKSDLIVFLMSHPLLWTFSIVFSRHTDKVKKIVADFLELKEVFNDPRVERLMIKKANIYTLSFGMMCVLSILLYTFNGIVQVTIKGSTFTTIITAWPLVDDMSPSAIVQRFLWNIVWWWMVARVLSVYGFVFSLTCCTSHQFICLQNYFLSLNHIFEDGTLTQTELEYRYEQAFKLGINMHSDSLKCVKQSKSIFGWIFSSQIIFNIMMLVLLMTQLLNTEITLMNAGAVGLAAFSILFGTGLFMCNAGDVSDEASKLSTAMFRSGWQNCQGPSSVKVRKLVIVSCIFAQRPVIIKGLGMLHLSYSSYVSVVKSTYSVFSLLCQKRS